MSINSEDRGLVFEADSVTSGITGTIKDAVILNSAGGMNLDPAHRPYSGISSFVVENVQVFPNAVNASTNPFHIGCDVVQAGDLDCNHSVSGVYTGEYSGGMSHLLPQNRYGSDAPLWPWPNESKIKADMCRTDSRGFCDTNDSITEYIQSF